MERTAAAFPFLTDLLHFGLTTLSVVLAKPFTKWIKSVVHIHNNISMVIIRPLVCILQGGIVGLCAGLAVFVKLALLCI